MKLKSSTNSILFLPPIIFLLLCTSTPGAVAVAAVAAAACNQTCGGWTLPFPFGFSAGCQIQLNCSSNGTVLAADFRVLSIANDTILVNIPASCSRPVEELSRLFTRNYAPTFLNAVLLQNCTGNPIPCFIPTTTVKTNFELQLECGRENDNITCYSETDNRTSFLDYGKLRRSGCRSLFSAISVKSLEVSPSLSLDVRIMRLGWWVLGDCSCSDHAKCDPVSPEFNRSLPAYRCRCAEGFVGDGFSHGVGCRKESQRCNLSKYISGQCRGATRILVLVGGALAAATLVAAAAVILRFIRTRSKLRNRSRSERSRKLTETKAITIPVYNYKEMEKATNFFSEKKMLGTGAYGTVYSGKLCDDKWVAIKRLKHRDSGSTEHVINEIKLLSAVSHPNLVRLLGCSIEKEEILVYEFMPNGTLCQHLRGDKGTGLAWPVRLNIAVETAQALSYLHNAMHPPIYHRDVKSSNILLDYDYKSKVADFGLSRLGMVETSHVSTAPQGTPGYVDPQYHQHFHLSDKSDVYSFGVVLVEIITALRVVDFSRPPCDINLAALAVDRIGRGCLGEIIDPFILKSDVGNWTISSVHKVAELAFRCLAFDRDMRPSMKEVAEELEQIKQSKWRDSDMSFLVSPEIMSDSASVTVSSDCMKKSEDQTVENEESGRICEDSSIKLLDTKRDLCRVSNEGSWVSDESTSISSNSLLNSTA
ncbi:Protein kinase superfamily protein [Perilla frutescens var. frutescens]|nr:Protein kinase superfamily protein [Perilla frutescens var. frutescens]